MLRGIGKLLRKLNAASYGRRVERSLALYNRGEARRDGLELITICHRLEIEWRARDVHPWDRDRADSEKRPAFVEQCLSDTEAAVLRLFDALPHLDARQLRVLALDSDEAILGGTVLRSDLSDLSPELSVGMRLRTLGITYHSVGSQFELLDTIGGDKSCSWPDRMQSLGHAYRTGRI